MYTVNMASDCTHEEASFSSLDEDNDLEEEITHLFNEVDIFIFKSDKKPQQIRF